MKQSIAFILSPGQASGKEKDDTAVNVAAIVDKHFGTTLNQTEK